MTLKARAARDSFFQRDGFDRCVKYANNTTRHQSSGQYRLRGTFHKLSQTENEGWTDRQPVHP